VFFLEFPGDGIHRAILGTDVASHAFIGVDLGFLAFACQEILNGFGGTFGGADAAIDADIVIDTGQVICDGDRIDRTVSAADTASDTRLVVSADSFGDIAFVFGGAFDINAAVDGDQHDQLTRTGHSASPTAGAFIIVNAADTILVQRYGTEHTSVHTVVLRHTAEIALIRAAGDIYGSFAGANTLVGIAPLGIVVPTGTAMDHGYFTDTGAGFHAHDLGYGKDGITASGGALVDQFAIVDNGIGISGTTGHSAGTAVGSRQGFRDLSHSGVNFHMKDLGGKGKHQSKDSSQASHNHYRESKGRGQTGF